MVRANGTETASLDPADWDAFRAQAHYMLDDAIDDIAGIAERAAWQPMPEAVRGAWHQNLPQDPTPLSEVYEDYQRLIAPYATGNRHPGFFGWVHGGGTVVGMVAEMLAAGLNANLGGRDHAPILCERQVIAWAAEMLGFPQEASGILVTGSSIANFMAVIVARTRALSMRTTGVGRSRLTGYASASAHACVSGAFDLAGIGTDGLRLVPTDISGRMNLAFLEAAIAGDRADGAQPFIVIGSAGTVDTGAVDDLAALATLCRTELLWFHVDAAYGAIAMLSNRYRILFAGIEQADSVAFDFHKWAQVPYDAGCLIVRDAEAHRAAFAQEAGYLARSDRGLAGGDFWPCDYGPDLSRGFRALKVWMTLKTYGTRAIGAVVDQCCALASYFVELVRAEPGLELVAAPGLNIVSVRVTGLGDAGHQTLAASIQEGGVVAPSTSRIAGQVVLRVAIVNHRTRQIDIDRLIEAIVVEAAQFHSARRCAWSSGCEVVLPAEQSRLVP